MYEYQRWASPLKSEIARHRGEPRAGARHHARLVVRAGDAPDPDYQVLVDIQRFDSALGDAVTIDALDDPPRRRRTQDRSLDGARARGRRRLRRAHRRAQRRARPREPRHRGRDSRTLTAADRMRAPRFTVVSRLGALAAAAMLSGAGVAQQHDPIGRIAAENAELSTQAAAATTALDRALAELAQLQTSKDALAESLRSIERREQVHGARPRVRGDGDRPAAPAAQGRAVRRRARGAGRPVGGDERCGAAGRARARRARRPRCRGCRAPGGGRAACRASRAGPQVEAALRGALANRSDFLARLAGLEEKPCRRCARSARPSAPRGAGRGGARRADGSSGFRRHRSRRLSRFPPRGGVDGLARALARGRRGPAAGVRAQSFGQRPRCSLRPSSTPRAADCG